MARFAVIENGVVVNVTEADAQFAQGHGWIVAPDGVGIGWGYDGSTFSAPPPDPPVVRPRHITVLAFRNRFTKAEKVGIEIASLDDPTATMAARQQAAAIRASMKDSEVASYIDLDRPDTRAGVQDLEAGGILAAGRALEILDSPIAEEERPR